MAGSVDVHGPSYISAHSADAILSDIRPIKLKIEALRAINVLLDEFLYNILKASHSLATDKLRVGLLKILPTSLGKEALLEAEVELRAYWDRTNGGTPATLDDQKIFSLQWAFELLRLKCQGYSTLNESDEDASAEARLNDRMIQAGVTPPKPNVVAPAALYLTAILESMCEHILSNVGRVAARDSSRTLATLQELFIALCEDDAIYTLFKSMKVYEQVESLSSSSPKPRRSKSFNRGMDISLSRNASRPQESSHGKELSAPGRSRVTSDVSSPPVSMKLGGTGSASRTSFDKSRAMKMFMVNSKSSIDRDKPIGRSDSRSGHRKTPSLLSMESKPNTAANSDSEKPSFENADFDNLVRSDATMKVSLTPDRLKTMEAHNKEKGQRGVRKPAPTESATSSNGAEMPPRDVTKWANGQSTLGPVTPITEDEDTVNGATPPSSHRFRQSSITSSPVMGPASVSRFRSMSAASNSTSSARNILTRKNSRKELPVASSTSPVSSPPHQHTSTVSIKTTNIVRHRVSLDLDDGASGDDESDGVVVVEPPRKRQSTYPVSPITRDLIDFLADGPPDSSVGNQSIGPPETPKSKSNRLQKMMSKLNIGTERQSRPNVDENVPKSSYRGISSPVVGSSLHNKGSFSSLANKPVPPRFPPASPPSPPGSSEDATSSRKPSVSRRALPAWEQKSQPPEVQPLENGGPPSGPSSPASKPSPSAGFIAIDTITTKAASSTASKTTGAPKGLPQTPPVAKKDASCTVTLNDAGDIRRLMAKATNPDECRVILDLFLAKCGVPLHTPNHDIPYPSPTLSDREKPDLHATDMELKHSLLELLLGGYREDSHDDVPQTLSEDAVPVATQVPEAHVGNGLTVVPPSPGKDTLHTSETA